MLKNITNILNKIQNYIDSTTMYKVLIITLLSLTSISFVYSFFEETGFSLISAILSLTMLLTTNLIFNKLISTFLGIKAHQESSVITALILYLIYTPTKDIKELVILGFVSLISVLSKYLVTKNDTHILNPAAAAAVISGVLLNYPATWWIGSSYLFPYVLLIALIVLRKQRKFIFASIFIIISLITIYFVYGKFYETTAELIIQSLLTWPLIFFVSIMVTEPFTLPTKKHLEYLYAILIGILTVIPYHVWKFGTSPELALVVANIVFFIIYPRYKYILRLKSKKELTEDIYEFSFESNKKVIFEAGQYMELMLPHEDKDFRGERRYFTISSNPNDKEIKFTIRINNKTKGSSYKKHLVDLEIGDIVYGQQIKGDFVLKKETKTSVSSKNNNETKYLFVAGGIGVTPFISIISYLIDIKSHKDIILLYISNRENDFVQKELFNKAEKLLGIKTYYLKREDVTQTFIKENISDLENRLVYISGPNAMVENYKDLFYKLGLSNKNIVTDYFNGF